ncbi:MAG: SLC13 family permease [Actinomycetota bacterium]|nr:SLC13 family permease [Actinomycetota bacterium]
MWIAAVTLGALVLVAGVLPVHSALQVTGQVAPVLVFLVAITVVAELADAAQVFDVAAAWAARLGRGSARRLFAWIVLLAVITTVVLSLDTTAVLFTPVVLAMAGQLDLDPLPYALVTVWLANAASLLLPVSNLTNLLAIGHLRLSALGFAARMALPELAAVSVTVLVVGLAYRRSLAARYRPAAGPVVRDRVLFGLSAAVCSAMAPLFVAGVPVQWPALAGAVVLAVAFAWRDPSRLRWGLLPWRLVLLVGGLFLAITAAGPHGLDSALGNAAGHDSSALAVLRTAGVAAAGSNAVNNLPAYLAMQRVAGGNREQLLGVLLGSNGGPMIALWGSLATLLWRQRCEARGVHIGAWQFARLGLVGVPVLIVATWAALLVTA